MILKKKSNTIFKISEIYNKYLKKINKKKVLILGSGKFIWEYYLKKKTKCKIISIDIIKSKKINFVKIDIFSDEFFNRVSKILNKVDIIICDICCKITGIKEKDSMFFLKLFRFLKNILFFLKKKGSLIFKYFNKCNIDKKFNLNMFKFVKFVKLSNSKKNSSETYAICLLKCI